jgi:hypothetical protein
MSKFMMKFVDATHHWRVVSMSLHVVHILVLVAMMKVQRKTRGKRLKTRSSRHRPLAQIIRVELFYISTHPCLYRKGWPPIYEACNLPGTQSAGEWIQLNQSLIPLKLRTAR